jgi:predicted nucleotidyltransferase
LDGEVLYALAGTTRGLTGREVARLTGRSSHAGVLSVLNRLTGHGLVDRVELNRASLFALNREHLAAEAVIALAELRLALLDRIRIEIERWELPPIHVSLFGSTARGDGDLDSDIDLFVVRPAAVAYDEPRWRGQLDTLAERIERLTGNRAAVHEVSEAELPRLAADEPPIVAQLRADSIPLIGPGIATLLDER